MHVKGVGSVNLAKKPSQQHSALRRDSVMLATCLIKRLSRSDP